MRWLLNPILAKMTDWATEYYRDPSFARQLAWAALLGPTIPVIPISDAVLELASSEIRDQLAKELEPIVEQIQKYPISEDEIKRMSAEIRSLYQ